VYDVSDPVNPKVVHYKVGMKDQTVWTSMMEDAPQHSPNLLRLSYGHSSYFPDCRCEQAKAKGSAEAPPVSPSAVGADVD
jgi:hypothetical protein